MALTLKKPNTVRGLVKARYARRHTRTDGTKDVWHVVQWKERQVEVSLCGKARRPAAFISTEPFLAKDANKGSGVCWECLAAYNKRFAASHPAGCFIDVTEEQVVITINTGRHISSPDLVPTALAQMAAISGVLENMWRPDVPKK